MQGLQDLGVNRMIEQQNLFGAPDAYGHAAPSQRHSPTSVAAADEIGPALNDLQIRLLAFLRERGENGATDEEGIEALGWSASTYRPRRVELVMKGLVRDRGTQRKCRSGRNAVVWGVA